MREEGREGAMDVMENLVKYVCGVSFEDIPQQVVSIVKRSLIDTIGVIIGGSSVDGCKLLADYVRDSGGRPESTVAVFGGKAPSALAAQVNGGMARALELDDIIDIFPLHPSASLIPTCLAVAERQGTVTGKDLITAIAVGHDLVIRLALSVKLSPVVSGRYNLFKVFAFTGSAGKLLGLTEAQLQSAMGIAYSQMVGDGQAQADGVMMSYLQQGTRAKSAIEAALMARAGITGTRTVLQGKFGFYNAYEPNPNLDVLTEELGKKFWGEALSIKLHSACRFTHQPIDLVQMFLSEGITADQIDSVIIKVVDQCYSLVCDPLERKRKPTTLVDAQYSIPFTTAATFLRGDIFVDEVSEKTLNDPKILALAQRVTPVVDPGRKTDLVVGSVVMEVKTRSGDTMVKQTEFPRGNPRNPVSMDGCVEKFFKCAAYAAQPFQKRQLEQIVEMVDSLEQVGDVSRLAALLVPR